MRRKRPTSATPEARRCVPMSSRYASRSVAWPPIGSALPGSEPHDPPNESRPPPDDPPSWSVTDLLYEAVGERTRERVPAVGEVEVVAAGEGEVPADELERVLGVGA